MKKPCGFVWRIQCNHMCEVSIGNPEAQKHSDKVAFWWCQENGALGSLIVVADGEGRSLVKKTTVVVWDSWSLNRGWAKMEQKQRQIWVKRKNGCKLRPERGCDYYSEGAVEASKTKRGSGDLGFPAAPCPGLSYHESRTVLLWSQLFLSNHSKFHDFQFSHKFLMSDAKFTAWGSREFLVFLRAQTS